MLASDSVLLAWGWRYVLLKRPEAYASITCVRAKFLSYVVKMYVLIFR